MARQEDRFFKLKTRKHQIASELKEANQHHQQYPQRDGADYYKRTENFQLPVLQVKNGKRQKQQNSKGQLNHFRWANKTNFRHSGTFQEAIAPVLLLAQAFALLPIRGIKSKNVLDLKFSWCHIRTIYAIFVFLCFGFYSGLTIMYAFRGNYNFDAGENIIFNVSTFLISGAFLSLARKWPALMAQWEATEVKLPQVQLKSQLSYRIKTITLIATVCSLVEHLLSIAGIIYYVNGCPTFPGRPIESFLHTSFSTFFFFFEYNTALAILGKALNVLSTFTWNFNDIFIMSVSVGLATRFHQLNAYMARGLNSPPTSQFWQECRVNYRSLCKLCDLIDDAISWTTLLCLSNNLYFICSKILKSIQKKPSIMHILYFWFSLFYLLGRTLALSLYTASINEESKRPLIIFRSIKRANWSDELKRFSDEVSNDEVALTGLKFFRLTRGMVLSVAGTIVTYELVLLQFNKETKTNDCYET